ncbi:hypothetical protein QOT17_013401 [Balamuthia mandrillaris]
MSQTVYEQQLKELFDLYDNDRDGELTSKEAKQFIRDILELCAEEEDRPLQDSLMPSKSLGQTIEACLSDVLQQAGTSRLTWDGFRSFVNS